MKCLVDVKRCAFLGRTTPEIDCSQDDRAVETETVKGDLERRIRTNWRQVHLTDIERKPRVGCAKENLAVFPLGEVSDKVGTACARRLDALGNNRIIILDVLAGGENILDVLCGLFNVALDIHRKTWSLGDGETEVQGNDTGNATETDEETPSVVDGNRTRVRGREDSILVRRNDNDADERGDW